METSNHENSQKLQQLQEYIKYWVTNCSLISGVEYIRHNKLAASLCMKVKKETDAIFHLTESHSAFLRSRYVTAYNMKQRKREREIFFNRNTNTSDSGLPDMPPDYLSYNNRYFQKGADGVLERLKDLPAEWTLVQLTFGIDVNEGIFGYHKDKVPDILKLHLTRLPCGNVITERIPVTVEIDPPVRSSNACLPSILEVISDCIKKITIPGTKKQKFQRRQEASSDLKSILNNEIISGWLKEWCCLMIGNLADKSLHNLVKSTIDSILSVFTATQRSKITARDKTILYQIVDSCAHLSDNDILKAVKYCIDVDNDICSALVNGIYEFKEKNSITLMRAKRNPVLLILDDNLDFIPWEMLPILFKHPVSRIPSLHFAHALYFKHKDDIVDGKKIVKNSDVAYYIINPEGDLEATEKYLLKLIQQRHPTWSGIYRDKPSTDQFVKSLLDYNILLYSGHGNGAQYHRPEDVYELNVNIVPFLFGCSSATKKHVGDGGKYELMGVSDHFFVAGCPCFIGMLWPVTTADTDLVTLIILNSTMSGSPININEIIGSEVIPTEELFHKEPELLRALKSARSVSKLFTNGAALIARGIPVEFQD